MMSDLRERVGSVILQNGDALSYEEVTEIIAAIAPDCETTEGLSAKERHLWLAINWDKELEQLQDGEWCDASQEVVNRGLRLMFTRLWPGIVWAPLRIKTQPVKPRVVWVVDERITSVEAIELTPEVRACLIEKGILDE